MKNHFIFFLSLLFLGGFTTLAAQDVPKTKVYSFKLVEKGESYHFTNPRYLTGFNAEGYNNQPNFINDNTLYLTVQFPDDSQTDIYSLDLNRNQITRVTKTIEGEYSPTPVPSSRSFSAVRVEADGANTQRLWQFPIDRKDNGQPIFEDITGIGYHLSLIHI